METNQHIGIFKNAVPIEFCNSIIEYFEWAQKNNLTFQRNQIGPKVPTKETADEGLSILTPYNLEINSFLLAQFHNILEQCYQQYINKYIGLQTVEGVSMININVQKTLPTQGYHMWHFESGSYETSRRLVVFSAFLNTVEEGGETEFIDQSFRLKAEQGTLALWPASYTHTHRGNPPLSGEKYLLTGWIGFR
jgi:hypothetical protein